MTASPEDFQSATGVSRETIELLQEYEALLKKWNPAINLVAPSTIGDLWNRHFLDSAQLSDLAPESVSLWADLGSGGGFPGVVVAILRKAEEDFRMSLIESDKRKAEFLRTVARQLGLPIEIKAERIEKVPAEGAQVLSARALAPLDKLLDFAAMHLAGGGTALFPKGRSAASEIEVAQLHWRFRFLLHPSKTDSEAVILEIGDLERV